MNNSQRWVAVIGVLMLSGCALMRPHRQPGPRPLDVQHVSLQKTAAVSCEGAPQGAQDAAGFPSPSVEGGLKLVSVEGDDRFSVRGVFAATFSGARVLTLQKQGAVLWQRNSGHVIAVIPFPGEATQLAIREDGAAVALGGNREGKTWVRWVSVEEPEKYVDVQFPGSKLRFGADGLSLFSTWGKLDLRTHEKSEYRVEGSVAAPLADEQRGVVLVKGPKGFHYELRNLWSGDLIRSFPEVNDEHALAVSGDGNRVALLDTTLKVFAVETGEQVAEIASGERFRLFDLNHDGTRLVEWTGAVVVRSSQSSAPREVPPAYVAVWDVSTKRRLFRNDKQGTGDWHFTRDGHFLIGGPGRVVDTVLRAESGQSLHFGNATLALSADSLWALANNSNGLAIYDVKTGQQNPRVVRLSRVLARSDEGRIVISQGENGALQLENERGCIRLVAQPNFEHVALSSDGSFAVMEQANVIRVWNTQDGVERFALKFSEGGRVTFAVRRNELWFQGEAGEITVMHLATGVMSTGKSSPRIGLGRPAGGEVWDVREHHGEFASPLQFTSQVSRGGKFVVALDYLNKQYTLSIWNLDEIEKTRDIPLSEPTRHIALSRDEKRIAYVGEITGVVHVNDIDGTPLTQTAGLAGETEVLLFSPSGKRLVVMNREGQLRLLDSQSGKEIGRVTLVMDVGVNAWFSPDERELVIDTLRGQRIRFSISP